MTDEPPRASAEPRSEEQPVTEPAAGKQSGETEDARQAADVADRVLRRHPLARGFILGAILTAAMAVFIVQNTQSVTFEWLWFEFGARLALALLVAFGLGLVVAFLAAALWRRAREQRSEQRSLLRRWTRGDKGPTAPPESRGRRS
jgi:uncharacterized integral membrane protein